MKLNIFFAAMILILFCACSTQSNSQKINNGFMNEHTYRVTATGLPRKDEKDISKRKDQALKAAILYSQYKIIEKFKGNCLQLVPCYYPAGTSAETVKKDQQIVKKHKELLEKLVFRIKLGKIIKAKFDDKQHCSILYEVTMENLQAKFKSCY